MVKGRRFLVKLFQGVKRPREKILPSTNTRQFRLCVVGSGKLLQFFVAELTTLSEARMPVVSEITDSAGHPDWGFLTAGRMPDGGPRYAETPPDPYAPDAPFPAEPWNALTASVFIVIALAWAWRLRGRYRDYPFLCWCLPILLAGGIGGTLYHATRTSVVLFLLDVV